MRRTPSGRDATTSSYACRATATGFAILVGLLTLAFPARGQQCVGSHIFYVARDAKGNAVDAAGKTFTADVDGGARTWSTGNRTYASFASLVPPNLISELKDKVAPLMLSAYCNFRTPVTLRITMSGETQELIFEVPKLEPSESRSFLVDGAPFQHGRFQLNMVVAASSHYLFYPASAWTKKYPWLGDEQIQNGISLRF
jgi:hypothetical protein